MATAAKRPNPFAIRLSDAERTDLHNRADRAGVSVAALFKAAVFDQPLSRQTRRAPVDKQELSRLMSAIGKIGSNVNQLAHQANTGSWPEARALNDACDDIQWMRDTVMRALGITPPPGSGIRPAAGP